MHRLSFLNRKESARRMRERDVAAPFGINPLDYKRDKKTKKHKRKEHIHKNWDKDLWD
tara:strand:+ start:188 stop:361 length:174 start_codon:yes stop_codon:yes gene_type:complete